MQGYAWRATRILAHQIATGMVDGEDMTAALMTSECMAYDRLDFFLFVWTHDKDLLYRKELSEEGNVRKVEQCWSVCLGHATMREAKPEAPGSAFPCSRPWW